MEQIPSITTTHIENLLLTQVGKPMSFEQSQKITLQALRVKESGLVKRAIAVGGYIA